MGQLSKFSPRVEALGLKHFWDQKILAEANGQLLKVAKCVGSANWHKHDDQDEVFFVLSGQLIIDLRDQAVTLNEGDLLVVPRGVEHRPRAEMEIGVLVIGSNITSTAEGGKPDWS